MTTTNQTHVCTNNHCTRCGECLVPPRILCDVCRWAGVTFQYPAVIPYQIPTYPWPGIHPWQSPFIITTDSVTSDLDSSKYAVWQQKSQL